MSALTHSDLIYLFAGAGLQVTILKQGQIGKHNDVPVEMQEATVEAPIGTDRAQHLRSLRNALRKVRKQMKNATSKAFTYGGTVIANGAFSFVTVGIACS